MKHFVLRIISSIVIVVIAVPSGAVFALDDTVALPIDQAPLTVDTTSSAPASTVAAAPEPNPSPDPAPTSSLPASNQQLAPTPTTAKTPAQPATAQAPSQAAPPVVPTLPAPITASDDMLVSNFRLRNGVGFDYIELHNTTSSYVPLDGVEIHLLYSSQTTDYDCQVNPRGYLQSNSYATFRQGSDGSDGTYPMSGCPQPGTSLFDNEIQVYRAGVLVESVRIAKDTLTANQNGEWERAGWTSTYRSGSLSKDFKVSTRAAYTSELYQPPESPSITFLEIMPHAQIMCMSGDAAPECHSYIKLKNSGNLPIDLSKFRLRSGDPNARPSSYNTSALRGVIDPGAFMTITADATGKPLAIDDEDGTAWFEDAPGLTSYQSSVTPYHDAELVAQNGRSWALDDTDATWKWASPSPATEANNFTLIGMGAAEPEGVATLAPCRADQYRSPETNRCRNLASTESQLTPCKPDQYRSSETNRCRSIASSSASSLKACADDQFRNPTTNRCKKIASTDDVSLADCGEGRERNPATNRCRNIVAVSSSQTPFAVEPVKQAAKSFIGWWVLGGIGVLAVGYATWEWREELQRAAQRLAGSLTHRR